MGVKAKRYHKVLSAYFLSKDYFLESIEKQGLRVMQLPPSSRSVNIRKIIETPWQLIHNQQWKDIDSLLTNILFLEAKAEAGMVFELASDFKEALDSMPIDCSQRNILVLLYDALLRDIQFIYSHPTTLFQCMWNSCWWYDSPEVLKHYEVPEDGRKNCPWIKSKLAPLMESWRISKKTTTPGFRWIRSLRPPPIKIGGGQKAVLRGHEDWVTCVIISQLSNNIISASRDKTIRIWDLNTGKQLNCLTGHADVVMGIACSSNEQFIASASLDKSIRIWDFKSGQQIYLFCHLYEVTCITFTPQADYFIFGDRNNMIYIWKVDTGAQLARLSGHCDIVTCVAVSPNGKLIASASYDSTIRIWDLSSREQLHCLDSMCHRLGAGINSVSFTSDSKKVISGEWGWTMRIWDVETGKEIKVITGPDTWVGGRCYLEGHEKDVLSISSDPNNQEFVSGSWDKTVRVWDVSSGNQLSCFLGHEKEVRSVCFSADSKNIISGGADKTIRIWENSNVEGIRLLHASKFKFLCIAFSPDGQRIVAGSLNYVAETDRYQDKELPEMIPSQQIARYVFDAHSGEFLKILYDSWQMCSTLEINCIEYSSDCRWFVTGEKGKLILWDSETGEPLDRMSLINNYFLSVTFSIDNSKIFCGTISGEVICCDTDKIDIKLLVGRTILKQECPVSSIAISNNGQILATGEGFVSYSTTDYIIRTWNPKTGEETGQLLGHKDVITSLRFSNDDHLLVSGSKDGTIRIWNTISKICLKVIEAFGDVNAIAVSLPKYKHIALCKNYGELVIKETESDLIEAFFPVQADNIRTHPSGEIWGCMADNHLYILRHVIEE